MLFLTHRRDAGASVPSSVSMGNVNILEADALNVLGMSISCDARWNDHLFREAKEAFKCLLKQCRKYFTPSDLLTIFRIRRILFGEARPKCLISLDIVVQIRFNLTYCMVVRKAMISLIG